MTATIAVRTMAAEQKNDPNPTTPFRLLSAPVLLNAMADRITVLIAVNSLATGWIEYGETKVLGKREDGQVAGMRPMHHRFLRFELTGLKPGTRYFYRLQILPIAFKDAYHIARGDAICTEIFSFRTLDPEAATASFTCWNDTHENRSTVSALADLAQRNPTDFQFWNGDATNDIHSEDQLIEQFLDPAGKPFANEVPLFFGRGNHDVRGKAARNLAQVMSGPDHRYYYAFRHGPLACLVLDTGEDKPDPLPVYAGLNDYSSYRTEQAAWLAKLIRLPWFREAPFRVAFLHIPLVWEAPVPDAWEGVWGPGIKGWMCEDGYNKWHSLLVDGKIDAVISGHIHKHISFPAKPGRSYAQLIGGGPQPDRAIAIEGRADSAKMEIYFRNLEGKVVETHSFARRS